MTRVSEYQDVFEFGLTARRTEGSLQFEPPYLEMSFADFEQLDRALGLNRLIVREFVDGEFAGQIITSRRGDSACGGSLSRVLIEIDNLNASPLVTHPGYVRDAHYLTYLLQECEYHLVRLADEYTKTVQRVIDGGFHMPGKLRTYSPSVLGDQFAHLAWIEATGVDRIYAVDVFAALADPLFFEMTACLTSLKRALNQLPVVLNLEPDVKNTFKASFRELNKRLAKDSHELEPEIAAVLESAWTGWAQGLAAQRDYLEHYAIPSALGGAPCAHIIFSGNNQAICTEALLPDNPEARKAKSLAFDRGIQYLGYCHDCFDRLLGLSQLVLAHVHSRLVAD